MTLHIVRVYHNNLIQSTRVNLINVKGCTLTSLMSIFVMLYSQTLGNGCAQFKSPSLLSHFPLIYHQGRTLMVEDLGGLGFGV